MNTVGEIGKFIYENQELIWAGLVFFAIILAIVIIGKIIVSQRKKTEMLRNIDRTVSQIHTAVDEMHTEYRYGRRNDCTSSHHACRDAGFDGNKDVHDARSNAPGVIYIDNRSLKADHSEPAISAEALESARSAVTAAQSAENAVTQKACAAPEADLPVSKPAEPAASEMTTPENPARKEASPEAPVSNQEANQMVEQLVEEAGMRAAQKEGDIQMPQIKFESLDYAVSRNGKSYTIEELEEQIK